MQPTRARAKAAVIAAGGARPMFLVVSATGSLGLGGEICRRLRAPGKPTRALVRPTATPRRVANLRRIGVELVEGDLKGPAFVALSRRQRTMPPLLAPRSSRTHSTDTSAISAGTR